MDERDIEAFVSARTDGTIEGIHGPLPSGGARVWEVHLRQSGEPSTRFVVEGDGLPEARCFESFAAAASHLAGRGGAPGEERRVAPERPRPSSRRPLAMLLALFAGAHLFYYLGFGLRFDTNTLSRYSQYIENEHLSARFSESLLHLHSQPPLFNLFLGTVLNLFPTRHGLVFHGLYLAFGFLLLWVVFRLMRHLGVSRRMALAPCALFAFSPSFLLYEHWLFYSLPEALLLAALCLAWFRAQATRRTRAFALFFALLLALCAMRSLFHLAYFLLALGALAWACRERWRSVVGCAALPLALLVGLHLKNYFLFGEFTTSTWLGMNLARVTIANVPLAERERLVAAGELSPVALVAPFSTLDKYPPEYRDAPVDARIPTLAEPRKRNGDPNYNHAAYIAISRAYLRDDLYVLRHLPGAYLKGHLLAWLLYFQSTSEYNLLADARRVRPMTRLYDTLVYGQLPGVKLQGLPVNLALLLGLPLLLAFGIRRALRRRSAPGEPRATDAADPDGPQRGLLLFLCANVLFVGVVGNLLDVGENNRFRFVTDPLSLVLLALALEHAAQLLRRRAGARALARSA